MPIYEYRCSACGFKKEYLQKLSDAPISDCERCGQPTMAKLVTAAGFQLKGSGWYATDFKNNGSRPKAKEAAKPDGDSTESGAKPSTEKPSTDTGDAKSDAGCGAGACPACQS